ncbi:MAG: LPS export ABC transporter periplasmic protein LptC [Bacteroidia bacterium]|nr:LPS export ABC transporter periplasmic protein LptC [Bacteroidia bacterium]NND11095.1 LPS export ABC transporter periplasmic protein LptC [Flavobacteriaceae bacterium]MBT8308799.1 LPS export ABC transporter periplasmic protein LptC [Bacteroidia bacterium]NNK28037.1 LPS export ABC transporter periplasmic protein LptC [Flavobacteriaceae bacterium]NNL60782.1 LPS export ABC transporter periplasmic protein LptC [Flavobacteriaceae bacterium]
MHSRITHNISNIVTIILVTMFFSCKNNFKEVQKIGISENEPIGIAKNISLKYTDSAKLKAHLISPMMLDYSNRAFAYNEFPEGINLDLYDDNGNKNTVVSDYAIVYDKTNLIDLQGNVVLTTYDGNILNAEQLYYDQEKEWLFTNSKVKFTTKDQIINGNGFDSNMDFSTARVLEITGYVYLDE